MAKLLKMFGKGVVITLMLPFILVIWVLYSVYCLTTFVIMFFVNVIEYFRGKNSGGDLIEDLEAKKILLEKEQADDQAKQMINIMYQNALAQASLNQPANGNNQTPVTPVPQYGIENLSQPQQQNLPEQNEVETEQNKIQPESSENNGENNE